MSDASAPQQHWDERYRERDRVWSGQVNAAVARHAARLRPGTALDLGCGEGGDAVWLAQQGWRVTAVDVSAVALERGERAARDARVDDRVRWVRADLAEAFPDGAFDLVSAAFLHSTIELPRDQVLQRAAAAVAPGGTLLVVGHAAPPPWAAGSPDQHGHGHGHDAPHMPQAPDVVASLALDPSAWEVVVVATEQREATGPDGERAVLEDAVVVARRHELEEEALEDPGAIGHS